MRKRATLSRLNRMHCAATRRAPARSSIEMILRSILLAGMTKGRVSQQLPLSILRPLDVGHASVVPASVEAAKAPWHPTIECGQCCGNDAGAFLAVSHAQEGRRK